MNTKSSKSLIYGKNTVLEALLKNPKRLNKIYIQKNFSPDNRLKKIYNLARENKINIQYINLSKFDEYFEQKPNYQGIIAEVSPVEYIELEEFIENSKNKEGFRKILILDGINDPHNLGAIIRTATGVAMDAIMLPLHRSCPINATVEKISSGAVNHIPIIKTTSLSNSIDILKKNDYWVIATQMNASDNYYEIDYTDMNFALVMGSEGDGISKTILNKADYTVKIKTDFDSLNVSVATGVILYEAQRQIDLKQS